MVNSTKFRKNINTKGIFGGKGGAQDLEGLKKHTQHYKVLGMNISCFKVLLYSDTYKGALYVHSIWLFLLVTYFCVNYFI